MKALIHSVFLSICFSQIGWVNSVFSAEPKNESRNHEIDQLIESIKYDLENRSCSYRNVMDGFNLDNAANDARSSYTEGRFQLIYLADGIGPSLPGHKPLVSLSEAQIRCLGMASNESKMLYIGGDSEIVCKESRKISESAYRYSSLFNETMLGLLIKDNLHLCGGNSSD